MGLVTNFWTMDLTLAATSLFTFVYVTYGTWIFNTAAILLSVVYFFYQYMFLYWRKHGIPQTSPIFPVGDLKKSFLKAPGEVLKDMYDKGKGHRFLGVWFLFQPAILLRDPELIKQILVKDFATWHERGIYVNEKYDPLSAHVFSMKGQRWRNLRAKLTPTFTSGKMKAMFPQFSSLAYKFEDILLPFAEKGDVIDVKEWCARFTTDLTTLTAFGITTNAMTDPNEPFRVMGRKVVDPSFITVVRSLLPFLIPDLASIVGIVTTPRDVTRFFLKATKDIVEYRAKHNIKRDDFIGNLIDLKNSEKLGEVNGGIRLNYMESHVDNSFKLKDLAAESFVFFVAGFETAADAISWAIYELALNPTLQEKTRDEIQAVLEKTNGELTYNGVQEMKYLDRVMEESLRMYPPAPLILRKSSAPYVMPGTDFSVPVGTQVHVSVHGLHRDPDHFPDPDTFDPDRFTEEAKAKRHHYSYLPFGEGPRNCFGMRYSMMQKKVGLIAMLNKFQYSLVKESPYPLELAPDSFVFVAKQGMKLKITKIEG